MAKETLTFSEKLTRALDGRSQTWVIEKMKDKGININDVKFSRKKHNRDIFTLAERKALSEILGVKL